MGKLNLTGGNIKGVVFWLGVVAVVLSYFFLLHIFALNIPHGDDFYAIIPFFHQFDVAHSVQEIIEAFTYTEKEHINVITRFLALVMYTVKGDMDFRVYTWIGNVFLVLIVLLWFRFFKRCQLPHLYFLPILLLLVNASYWEISIKGLMAIQHFGVIFFSLLCFWQLEKNRNRNVMYAMLCAIAAIYSFGNGILTLPIGVVLLVLMKRKKHLIWWSVFSTVMIALVVYHIYGHAGDHLRSLPLLMKVRFFFTLFAGILNEQYLYSSFFVGFITFVGVLYFLWKNGNYQKHIFITATMLFIVGSVLLITFQRSNRGMMVAFIARYPIYSSMMLGLLYMLLMERFGKVKTFLIGAISVALFFNLNSWVTRYDDMMDRKNIMLRGLENWSTTKQNFWLRDGKEHRANKEITEQFTRFVEEGYYVPPLYLVEETSRFELQK